jgi:fructokinase
VESQRIVCLGEALVDFVCERPVPSLGVADYFVPRQGGSLANIAVAAARFGGQAEMLGGAGDDEWGRWLRDRIAAEGVGIERFVLMPGAGTSHAFVSVDQSGEPSFAFYGDPERPAAHAEADIDPALDGEPGVLVVGSDTLLGVAEREVTMRAAAVARERGWQVLCDPNLRANRWETPEEMVRVISALVERASVVKLNEGEAVALSGYASVEAAGEWLLGLGPKAAVVTRGSEGALLLCGGRCDAIAAPHAEVVDATGAGDSVAGVVAAGLARGIAPSDLAPVVEVAMRTAARVVAVWGATPGLPPAAEARDQLDSAI